MMPPRQHLRALAVVTREDGNTLSMWLTKDNQMGAALNEHLLPGQMVASHAEGAFIRAVSRAVRLFDIPTEPTGSTDENGGFARA